MEHYCSNYFPTTCQTNKFVSIKGYNCCFFVVQILFVMKITVCFRQLFYLLITDRCISYRFLLIRNRIQIMKALYYICLNALLRE